MALNDRLNNLADYNAEAIEKEVKAFLAENELGFGAVLPFFRIALAGTMKGPAVFELIELLGKEEVVNRMNTAYEYFDKVKAQVI